MAVNQEMLQRYITLANEGKIPELAELLINNNSKLPVLEGRNNEEADSIGDTLSAFYKHLAELTPEGEIDPAKKQIVYKLSEEFARIRSNAVIETGKKYKEWKQRIADGEIQEANIVDAPGFSDALAHDMALCKTEDGKKLTWANQLNGGLKSILENSGQKWNDEVKTPEYQKFSDKIILINRDILDVPFVGDIYKQHTEVTADEIRQFHKMFGDNPQPATASYNFKVEEDYEYSPDKPIFYKLPNELEEIMKAKTAEQLDEIRQKHLETLENAKEFQRLTGELVTQAKGHLTDINGSGNIDEIKDNQIYKNFSSSLRNLTRLGTNGFKVHLQLEEDKVRVVKTNEIFPDKVVKAVKNTLDKANAHSNRIDEFYDPDSFYITEHDEFVDETIIDLKDEHLPKLEKLAKKLPSCAISKTIANEQKQLARIDAAIKARKYDEYRMKRASRNTAFAKSIGELDSCIATCGEAQKNVRMGGDDYNQAEEALKQLSMVSKVFKETAAKGSLSDKDLKSAAEALRAQAMETRKKVDAYTARKNREKAKKNRLDAKGTKRLAAMNDSSNALNTLIAALDDQIASYDFSITRNEYEKMQVNMKNKITAHKNNALEDAANEQLENNRRIAANGAAEGFDVLSRLANGNGELTDEEKRAAVEAMTKVGYYKMGLYEGREDELNSASYQGDINSYSKDSVFENVVKGTVGELTREKLLSIASEYDLDTIMTFTHRSIDEIVKIQLERSNVKNVAKSSAEQMIGALDEVIDADNDPNAEYFDEQPVSLNIQAAQTAKRGLETLIEVIHSDEELGELDEEEMTDVREAYAALAFQSTVKPGDNEKVEFNDYVSQVKLLANDEEFIKAVGNIDKKDVADFMTDSKSPAKLMDKFMANKKRAAEEDAKSMAQKIRPEPQKQVQPKAL